MQKRILIAVLLLHTVLFGMSQYGNLVFHPLNKEKNFSQSVCNDVFKDSRGFIWISATSGLFRYDGVNFIDVTRADNLLKGHALVDIVETKNGNIWLSKYNTELVKYDPETGKFEVIALKKQLEQAAIITVSIKFLHVDEYDRIWLRINDAHLAVYDTRGKLLRLVYQSEIPLQVYFDLQNIYKSVFYLNDKQNAAMHRGSIDSTLTLSWHSKQKIAMHVSMYNTLSDKDNIWFVHEGKLFNYNWKANSKDSFLYNGQAISQGMYHNLLLDRNNHLWISTLDGVCVFDVAGRTFANYYAHDPGAVSSVFPNSIPALADTDNIIWFTSWGKGINYTKLGSVKFKQLLTKEIAEKNRIDNYVRAMSADDNGNVYAALEKGGIVMLDSNGVFIKKLLSPVYLPYESLLKDRLNNIWMGGERLKKYNTAKKRIDYESELCTGTDRITCLHERADGNLLLGTYNRIRLFNKEQQKIKDLPGVHVGSAYSVVYELPDKNMLGCQRDEGVTLYKPLDNGYSMVKIIDPALFVKSILPVSADTLLLATTVGLYHYCISRQTVAAFDEVNRQLPDLYLYSVLKDKKGYYWCSTNTGLFRWNVEKKSFKSFGKEFGLQDLEFNTNAWSIDNTGNLYFGGINGINKVDDEIPDDFLMPPPNLQLLGIESDKKQYISPKANGMYEEIVLAPGNTAIEIEYNSIDFLNPGNIKVKYRLKNYNDVWIVSDNSGKARFVNLQPGKYEFEIISTDSNGQWTEKVYVLPIFLQPYWWQTAWFKIAVLLLFIVAMVVSIKFLINRRLKKQRVILEKEMALQRERERISRDLHDNVGATLSSIKVYSEILKINPNDPQLAELISANSSEMIEGLELIAWSTNHVHDHLRSLKSMMRKFAVPLCHVKGIEFRVSNEGVDDDLQMPGEIRQHLFLIFKESVNNMVKYAEATACVVEINIIAKQFTVTISDNGKGFDGSIKGTGNGLLNMQQRANKIGGKLTINSEPGKGTIITIVFPYPFFIPDSWDSPAS